MSATFTRYADTNNQGGVFPDSIRCNGANHRDRGDFGRCDGCLAHVARVGKDKGQRPRLVDTIHRTTEGGREFWTYSCWSAPTHVCDPQRAALVAAEKAEKLAAGELIKGQRVRVVKGRKVAKGTEGVITWTGESDWGPRLGIRDDQGQTHWTAASNVEAVI